MDRWVDGRVQGWMEGWMDKQVGIQVEILLFTCLICCLPLILEISLSLFQIFLLSHSPFLSFWYSNTYLTPPEIASEFLRVLFHFFKNSPFCLNLHSWSLCYLWWSFLGHVQTTDKFTNGKLKLVFLICSINFWFLLIFHLFTLQTIMFPTLCIKGPNKTF